MAEVKIYVARFCPFCTRAIKLLKSKGVALTEFDITSDYEMRAIIEKKTGSSTVPQIFVDDQYLGDCDYIYALESYGELDSKLKIGTET